MSFILDALKKLEQKRNQESIPDLLTVHSSPAQKPQKRLIWFSMIVLALFINAGILLALLKPWQSEKQVIATQSSSEQPESISPGPSQNSVEAEPAAPSAVLEKTAGPLVPAPYETKPSSESAPVKENTPRTSLASKEEVTSSQTLPAESKPDAKILSSESEFSGTRSFLPDEEELADLRGKIKEEIDIRSKAPSDESAISVDSISGSAASHEELIKIDQLPSDIRSELPKISINTHIYSNNPSSRVVNINGIVLREGEDVAKGLTLEEITTSGVILTYKNHRFRIRAF